MSRLRISKTIAFDMAHALPGYPGKCRNIHGHCYKLTVTVTGTPNQEAGHPENGMVADFGNLKQLLKQEVAHVFDHSLVLPEQEGKALKTSIEAIYDTGQPARLILVPFQPTAENMLLDMLRRIRNKLPDNVTLTAITLNESETSKAEWYLDDQDK